MNTVLLAQSCSHSSDLTNICTGTIFNLKYENCALNFLKSLTIHYWLHVGLINWLSKINSSHQTTFDSVGRCLTKGVNHSRRSVYFNFAFRPSPLFPWFLLDFTNCSLCNAIFYYNGQRHSSMKWLFLAMSWICVQHLCVPSVRSRTDAGIFALLHKVLPQSLPWLKNTRSFVWLLHGSTEKLKWFQPHKLKA